MRLRLATLLVAALIASACASAPKAKPGEQMKGLASWYGQEYAGRTTANGEIFDPMKLTAAHRTLPFGTVVDVKNPKNERNVAVRINDRGPFVGNRIIDLSYAAAREIDLIDAGVAPVELTILRLGAGEREAPEPFVVPLPQQPAPVQDPVTPPPIDFPLPDSASKPAETERPRADTPETFRVQREEVRGEPAPKPETEPEPQREVKAAPQPDASTFLLQIGAFQNESNAQQLRDRVAEIVPAAYLQLANGLHRVRVGPFRTKAEAIDAREKLDAAGIASILLAGDK